MHPPAPAQQLQTEVLARIQRDDPIAALVDLIRTRPTAQSVILTMLPVASRPAAWNAMAMALLDVGSSGLPEAVRALLRRDDVYPNVGTLLYALTQARGALPLALAVRVVESGSDEANGELLGLFEAGLIADEGADIPQILDRLERLAQRDGEPGEWAACIGGCVERRGT